MPDDRDSLEHVLGYVRTQFDCFYCDYTFDEEGDCAQEVIQCPSCQKKFYCFEIR